MRLTRWTYNMLANRPESLLKLLRRAHELDVLEGSMVAAYRAGIIVGAAHPELAQNLEAAEYPVPVSRGGVFALRRLRR